MFVTENFGGNRPQRPRFSRLKEYRQAITSIEDVLDTEMPRTFTADVLTEFGATISATIDAIRRSNDELGKNEECVLESLREARDYTELARDEALKTGNNKKRYQYIRSVRKELKAALTNWQVH